MTNNVESWKSDAIKLAETGVLSWREIAKLLEVPKSTCSDLLREYFKLKDTAWLDKAEEARSSGFRIITVQELVDKVKSDIGPVKQPEKQYDNTRVLFISDMHVPYNHPKMLHFLEGLKVRYEPTRVICVGDELDKNAMSFHDSDPDLPSAGDELSQSLPIIKELEKMFPDMDLVDSNHGSMVYRKAKHHGIPRRYIKPYNEVLGVGDGWQWHMDLVLDMSEWDVPDVYVHHGKSAKSVKTSQAMAMSHVCGHFHESFGIEYWSSPAGLFYGMNIGCLIDDDKLAFSYNNANLKRPIVGTGLIIEGIPVLEAMPL